MTLDKLMKIIDNFQFKNRFCDLFDELMHKCIHLLECKKVTLFILNENIQSLYINIEKPPHPPQKAYIGRNVLTHKLNLGYTPNEAKFKYDDLNKIVKNEKSIICPIIRYSNDHKKENNKVYIVLQFDTKVDNKSKKKGFTHYDEIITNLLSNHILKNIEFISTMYQEQH